MVVPIRLPANYVPGFNIFVSYDGESAQPVNYMNPLPVRASYIAPQYWSNSSFDARAHDALEFQITAASGGPWTPKRSLDGGTTWEVWKVSDQDGNTYSSLTVAHVGMHFSLKGRGLFMLAPSNGGDTIAAFIRAS